MAFRCTTTTTSLSLSLSPHVQDKIFGGMLQGHDCRCVQTFRGLIIKLVCCWPPPLLLPATYLLQPDPSSSKRPEAGSGGGGGLRNIYRIYTLTKDQDNGFAKDDCIMILCSISSIYFTHVKIQQYIHFLE